MLINKCKLFSEGGHQELVRLYLARSDRLCLSELVDNDSIDVDTTEWRAATLERTLSPAARQAMVETLMNERTIYAVDFVYRSLNDEQIANMYKWSLGISDDHPLTLASLLAQEGISPDAADVYEVLYRTLNDRWRWLTFKELCDKLPLAKSVERSLIDLVFQIRSILIAGNGGRSPDLPQQTPFDTTDEMVLAFVTGKFSDLLWQRADDRIIQLLEREFLTIFASPRDDDTFLKGLYYSRVIHALRNPNLTQEMKGSFFATLLNEQHGQLDPRIIVALLRSEHMPDEYLHACVAKLLQKWKSDGKANRRISTSDAEAFSAFLLDPRLTTEERDELCELSRDAMHDYLKLPDQHWKHARHLTPAEIEWVLKKCTGGLISSGSAYSDYSALREATSPQCIEDAKESLRDSEQALRALFRHDLLSDVQTRLLLGVMLLVDMPNMLNVMCEHKSMSPALLGQLEDDILAVRDGPIYPLLATKNRQICNTFILKVCQLYLNQDKAPDELLKRFLHRHLADKEIWRDLEMRTYSTGMFIPISVPALLSAMDYQKGYAFELIETFIQNKPELDVVNIDGKSWERSGSVMLVDSLHMTAMVKLAITREIYPALLQGEELDPYWLTKIMALAVIECRIDEFDLNIFRNAKTGTQFEQIASVLLTNSLFAEKHAHIYDELTAEVLKRKTDAVSHAAIHGTRCRVKL